MGKQQTPSSSCFVSCFVFFSLKPDQSIQVFVNLLLRILWGFLVAIWCYFFRSFVLGNIFNKSLFSFQLFKIFKVILDAINWKKRTLRHFCFFRFITLFITFFLFCQNKLRKCRLYGLVGQVTALYVRESQFKRSCGHWKLWSIINLERDIIDVFEIWNLDRNRIISISNSFILIINWHKLNKHIASDSTVEISLSEKQSWV